MRSHAGARVCAQLAKVFLVLAVVDGFLGAIVFKSLYLMVLAAVLAGAAAGTFIARLQLLPQGEIE